MWPDPAWLKNYVKGAWSATINLAAGLATSTYNNASNGVTATKSVYNAYKNDGVKGAVKEYANQVYTTSGAKSAVATVKKASTGDAKAVATTVFNVAAIAIVHKVAKGSGATVEASEASSLKSSVTAEAVIEGGAMSGKKLGHTFTKHGIENTNQLTQQAKNGGSAQGQWLDHGMAEQIIYDNLGNLKNGSITVPIPENVGRVINIDGTFSPATHARIVPSGSGVKTAYPLIIE